jgi:hypothetical protein
MLRLSNAVKPKPSWRYRHPQQIAWLESTWSPQEGNAR